MDVFLTKVTIIVNFEPFKIGKMFSRDIAPLAWSIYFPRMEISSYYHFLLFLGAIFLIGLTGLSVRSHWLWQVSLLRITIVL